MTIISKLSKNQKGFTLIELIMVIAVLGILAGIAIPRITGIQDKARYAAGEALLANMKTPLELYRQEKDKYPDVSDYENLKDALTGESGYLDNMENLLPKTSEEEWHFENYNLDGDTYTLVITHPNNSIENLTMTSGGIENPN
mgnify:CR=1 FL=1